ncbi:MAG: diacylglycerol kinase family lipid kinase [Clostridia bacterium]|nr:diacylglycerol kinase family lipid kinase [Clostridia bacterium]
MSKFLIVYNPKAGKNSKRKRLEDVVSVLSEGGKNDVETFVTEKRADATDRAKSAQGYDAIAVVGGDGTLNEVLNGILSLEESVRPAIIYIPGGTTNQTAKAFGLPTDLKGVAALLQEGEFRPFDLGSFNGRAYIDVCAFGYGSESSLRTSQRMKNKFGFFAFVLNQIKYLFRLKRVPMRIRCDGETYIGEYVFGNLVNTAMVSTFARLKSVGVRMDDGKLDLVLIDDVNNFFGLLAAMLRVIRRRFNKKKVYLISGKKFELEFFGDRSFLLDGERVTATDHATVEVLPHAFRMLVPKE